MNDEAAAGSVPPISADPPPSAVVASPAAAGSTARGAERGARVPSSGRRAPATGPARTAGRQRGRRMTRAQAPPKTGAPTLSAPEANRPPVPPPHLTTEFVHPTPMNSPPPGPAWEIVTSGRTDRSPGAHTSDRVSTDTRLRSTFERKGQDHRAPAAHGLQ